MQKKSRCLSCPTTADGSRCRDESLFCSVFHPSFILFYIFIVSIDCECLVPLTIFFK
ncbi:hypothetical protein DAPPUDRAFT_300666 [Daphnia pulex]|uniref:Uncharacterized protein n=1 Tax=Daphnia pulex TaxID=6669 RepID=E9HEK0_DAPPU|nr:hypothetical protein DAPPUDRAFT_300666 [Daphnia pulex]|eukprot:EFX69860.1 hypothetical protein DAPPUDRAFT_300666 [Daphnia pulex]